MLVTAKIVPVPIDYLGQMQFKRSILLPTKGLQFRTIDGIPTIIERTVGNEFCHGGCRNTQPGRDHLDDLQGGVLGIGTHIVDLSDVTLVNEERDRLCKILYGKEPP